MQGCYREELVLEDAAPGHLLVRWVCCSWGAGCLHTTQLWQPWHSPATPPTLSPLSVRPLCTQARFAFEATAAACGPGAGLFPAALRRLASEQHVRDLHLSAASGRVGRLRAAAAALRSSSLVCLCMCQCTPAISNLLPPPSVRCAGAHCTQRLVPSRTPPGRPDSASPVCRGGGGHWARLCSTYRGARRPAGAAAGTLGRGWGGGGTPGRVGRLWQLSQVCS